MNIIKPPALNKGDTIGVMSTSCWLEQADLDRAQHFFEAQGYNVKIHPQATARLNQSAGSAQEKVDAFHALFLDNEVKAILGARGGNRASTMLSGIDWHIIKNNPKILMGYSDMTVLLNGAYVETGLVTFHGPLFREMPERKEFENIMSLLAGNKEKYDLKGSEILQAGTCEGKLIGGNLSLLQVMSGTRLKPETKGAILFIEDIGDHISRYDRMLAHLRLSGWFDGLSGIIFGDFSDMKDDENRPFGFALKDIILEHTRGLDIPIIMNAPFGHGDDLPCFPVGGEARLQTEGGHITLELTQSAVSV